MMNTGGCWMLGGGILITSCHSQTTSSSKNLLEPSELAFSGLPGQDSASSRKWAEG